MTDTDALVLILHELDHTRDLRPNWPVDIIHQTAVMAGKAGAALRAALDMTYANGAVESLRREALLTVAMCIRILTNLDRIETRPAEAPEVPQ